MFQFCHTTDILYNIEKRHFLAIIFKSISPKLKSSYNVYSRRLGVMTVRVRDFSIVCNPTAKRVRSDFAGCAK